MPGFSATLLGGIVAVFVGIPLTSPDDRLGNTAGVAVASAVAALAFGLAWSSLSGDAPRRARLFSRICLAAFAAAVAAAILAESAGELANTVSYVVPLAAIVCVSAAAVTPLIERKVHGAAGVWLGSALLAGVLAIGITLALYEVGYTEPPSLSLPPPP